MAEQPPGGPSQPPLGPPAGPPGHAPPGYGYPQTYYGQQQYGAQGGNGIAIAAGVCGIIAVVFCWIPFDIISIVLGALAIVFGSLGNQRATRSNGSGRGMAVTGIVCGTIAIVISILFMGLFIGHVIHSGVYTPTG